MLVFIVENRTKQGQTQHCFLCLEFCIEMIETRIAFIKEMVLGFWGTAFPVLKESPVIFEYELFGTPIL
jgi:hypothetical protein